MGDIIIPFNIFLCQFYYHLTLATYKNDVDGVGHFSLRSMNRSTICRSCLLIVNDVVGTTVCSTADEKATGVFVQVSYGDTHSTPNDFKEACLFVDHNLKSVSVQLKKCSCWWPLFSILDWPLYRLWCSRWCCNPPFYHCCLVYWSVRHRSMLMFTKPWELESPAYHSNSPTKGEWHATSQPLVNTKMNGTLSQVQMASNKNVVPTSYRIVSFEMIYLIVAYRTLVKCLVGEEDRNGK